MDGVCEVINNKKKVTNLLHENIKQTQNIGEITQHKDLYLVH